MDKSDFLWSQLTRQDILKGSLLKSNFFADNDSINKSEANQMLESNN